MPVAYLRVALSISGESKRGACSGAVGGRTGGNIASRHTAHVCSPSSAFRSASLDIPEEEKK